MAGSYCRFCDQRCFVDRKLPEGHKCSDFCAAICHTWHLATCAEGAALDRRRLGYDYSTAINPALCNAALWVAAELAEYSCTLLHGHDGPHYDGLERWTDGLYDAPSTP